MLIFAELPDVNNYILFLTKTIKLYVEKSLKKVVKCDKRSERLHDEADLLNDIFRGVARPRIFKGRIGSLFLPLC